MPRPNQDRMWPAVVGHHLNLRPHVPADLAVAVRLLDELAVAPLSSYFRRSSASTSGVMTPGPPASR